MTDFAVQFCNINHNEHCLMKAWQIHKIYYKIITIFLTADVSQYIIMSKIKHIILRSESKNEKVVLRN